MTTTQLYLFYLFNFLYLVLSVVVAILTRATPRRIAGALAGGAASGVVTLSLIAVWERLGWWHMVMPGLFTWEPYFLTLMLMALTLLAFIFLITWRIARRFGWRGLAVVLLVLAVIGPLRDQWIMRRYPEFGSYGPGIAPVLAISVSYVVLVLVGHGVMRLVAGPAREDRLARRPWESS
jgi:hypothetical protein